MTRESKDADGVDVFAFAVESSSTYERCPEVEEKEWW